MISVQKLLIAFFFIVASFQANFLHAEYRSFDSQNHREEIYRALNKLADSFQDKVMEQESIQAKGIEVASIEPVLLSSLSDKSPAVRFDITYRGDKGEAGETIECQMRRDMKIKYSNNFEEKQAQKSMRLSLSNCITRSRFADDPDFFDKEHSLLLEDLDSQWESDATYAQSIMRAIERGLAADEHMDEIIRSYSAPERSKTAKPSN